MTANRGFFDKHERSANNPVIAAIDRYKTFDDYTDFRMPNDCAGIGLTTISDKMRHRCIAYKKKKSCDANATYTDDWYLLRRLDLFHAEVEKAMSEIYSLFLETTIDIDILKDGEDNYYVASHAIRNFQPWDTIRKHLQLNLNGTLFYKEDDNMIPVKGIGTICALTEFFDDTDSHSGNIGLVAHGDYYQLVKIDCEKALKLLDASSSRFEQDFKSGAYIQGIGLDITSSKVFKDEKDSILLQIAKTDFSILEDILKRNITSSMMSNALKKLHLAMNSSALNDPNFKPENYGVERIINILKEKHVKLKRELNVADESGVAHLSARVAI